MASVSLVKSAGGLVWRTGGELCVPAGHKVFCEEEGVSDRVSLLWILMLVCRDSCGLGGLIVVLDCLGLVLVGKRQGLWMVLGWWTSSGGVSGGWACCWSGLLWGLQVMQRAPLSFDFTLACV